MDYENGPDQLIPSNNIYTTDITDCVALRTKYSNENVEKSVISIPGLLHKTATLYPEVTALITNNNGVKIEYTYREYEENVRICAKVFLKLGLKRFESVGIIGFNSPEWFFANLGAIYAGGISAGIYTTNSSEACYYCADNANITIFVAEDEKQVNKIMAIKSKLTNLRAIIQYSGKPEHDGVLSWEQLMQLGREESDDELNKVLKKIAINQCSTIVYTSGTVGNPKGVMLSHDNIVCDAFAIRESLKMKMQGELVVSYLPLSHVAAQMLDMYLMITCAGTVYFADKNALKGTLLNSLKDALPTKFLGVPRVWEKFQEQMLAVGAQNGYVKKMIGNWAKSQGLKYNMDKINGVKNDSWGYYLANILVLKKIKQALGFERCTLFASAAAPLSSDVKKYFLCLDMPIMEAFGMSEVAGAHTINSFETYNLETIGQTVSTFQTKIFNPDENNEGEICMYGRHVFMGYLGDIEKTKDTIDEDGWLHSGDIGKIDENRMLYVTGRLKELLITAGGENIPPVPIEQKIKAELPVIGNAVLVGDRRKFLSILLAFKTNTNVYTGVPTDTFTNTVLSWLKTLECDAQTVTELREKSYPKVMAALQQGIDKVNTQAISNAQRIQKFTILPCDFSIPTGELGPTMKIKRNVVHEKYKNLIDELYT